MTIQSIPYQTFSGMDYAISESLGGIPPSPSSYDSRPRYVSSAPAQISVEGIDVDTMRVIDLLLGQLEQLSYQLARTEAQTEPFVAQTNADTETDTSVASTEASYQARLDTLVELYSQVRAEVEAAGLLDDPYIPAGPFAGMLFDVAA